MKNKVELSLDNFARRLFRPASLVLVSTLSSSGMPNVAPKTQVMPVGRKDYWAFACCERHHNLVRWAKGRNAGQRQIHRRGARVASGSRHHLELHHLTRRVRVRRAEINAWCAPAKWLIWAEIL